MPITIPPFVAYQSSLFPVSARWRNRPPEGDKFIALEIDWGVTVPVGQAVQISLNSGPVEFSQLVALSVDNGRNGGDVSFIFPDTGRQLTVPAYSQGIYPVFTNAMTFYVLSESAVVSDTTQFEVLNSMPPPVSVLPSQEQSHAGVTGISIVAAGTATVVPAPTAGTVSSFNIIITSASAANVTAQLSLQDGTGALLWAQGVTIVPGQTIPISVSGVRLRFSGGLFFVVGSPTGTAFAIANVNVYYSIP